MIEELSVQSGQGALAVPGWLFYLTLASAGLLLIVLALMLWQRSADVLSLAGGFLAYCF
jgi:hypothetical protein